VALQKRSFFQLELSHHFSGIENNILLFKNETAELLLLFSVVLSTLLTKVYD